MSQKFLNSIEVDGQVSAEYLDLSTTTSHSVNAGEIAWNSIDGTFDIGLLNGVTLQAGQEMHFYGKATEAISNGNAVMFAGVQGDHILIAKADAVTINTNPEYFMGVATQDFSTNDFGYVTAFGNVRGIDTSAYTLSDILYYDSTSATDGLLTPVEPSAPKAKIIVAAVVKVHATQGILAVRPHTMPRLKDIQDINIDTASAGEILQLQSDGVWENKTLSEAGIVSGSGTTNYVSKFTGATSLGNSQIFDNGSAVGIGTTSPTEKLDVNGSIKTTGEVKVPQAGIITFGTTWNTGTLSFNNGPTTALVIDVPNNRVRNNLGSYLTSATNIGRFGTFDNFATTFVTNNTERVRITSTGNVGIGTISPSQLLHVNGRTLVNQFEYTRAIPVSNTDLNNLTNAGFYNGTTLTNSPGAGWYYITVERYTDDANWVKQTATSFGSGNTGNITWTRTRQNGTWQPWKQLMDTAGTGATGTWGISITGNSATATTLQTTRTIWGQNFNGSQNVSGNLTSVGNITGTSNVIINSPTNRTVWVTPVLAAMQGESFNDMGMIGVLYDRNELTNAAYRGNITINITGAGTFTDSTDNKNRLVNASGDFMAINTLDPTSVVQITVDVGSNVNNYSSAVWQPFFQTRLDRGTSYTYPNSISVEVSLDGTNWSTASSGWTISDFLTNNNEVTRALWLGTRATPTVPTYISSWRYARFTLSNFQIGTSLNILWISQIGIRHASAPVARQYLNQVGGNNIWGNQLIDGNVGIGTTSPQARLDVKAQGALSTDIAFRVRNSADSADLMSVNGLGTTTIGNTTTGNVALNVRGNIVANSNSSANITLGTNASNVPIISGLGNGLNIVTVVEYAAGNARILLQPLVNNNIVNTVTGTGVLLYNTGGSERMRITNTGQVTIGATTAGARLDVRAQGALSTDIAFRVRNSADSKNFLVVNGAGDVFNNGAGGGDTNTHFGENTARARTGNFNSTFGNQAGRDLTTGASNALFGYNAGRSLTTASGNVLIGPRAGELNNANNTVAIGGNALLSNISSLGNTAVGDASLSLTTAGANTALGSESGINNTTGQRNTFIGRSSGRNNTTGQRNVYLGTEAGLNQTTGNNNFFVGDGSGRYEADGVTNLTTATNSLFIGDSTRGNASGQTNQIVIGYNAIGLGSNTVVLGNDSIVTTALKGKVGIGTTNPSTNLHVFGNSSAIFPSVKVTHDLGFLNQYIEIIGSALEGGGIVSVGSTSSIIFKRGSNESMRINDSGNVGIGNTSPTQKLDVTGNIKISNNNSLMFRNAANNADISIIQLTNTNQLNLGTTSSSVPSVIALHTNSAERMRITSGGEILIGGTFNPYSASNRGNITLNGSSSNIITFTNNSLVRGYLYHDDNNFEILNNVSGGAIISYTQSSERMRITADGNVGIGTSSPGGKLTVVHSDNNYRPALRIENNNTGASAITGISLGQSTSGGAVNASINLFQNGDLDILSNDGAAWFRPRGNTAMYVDYTGGVSKVTIGGSNTQSYPLRVTQQVSNTSIYADYDIVAFSDQSVKTNIRPIENALERVVQSRGVLYDRTDSDNKDNIGFIAQELEVAFPELVVTNEDGTKAVKYQNTVAVLFEAIKEQQKQIEELKQIVNGSFTK